MLALAVRLAMAEAAGRRLNQAEQRVSDIMWIGTQVSPNGFDGWLAYTSAERMQGTLAALREVGCTEVMAVVEAALAVAGIDVEAVTDDERERLADGMTEEQRIRLRPVDDRFFDVYEPSMRMVEGYAVRNGLGPPWE